MLIFLENASNEDRVIGKFVRTNDLTGEVHPVSHTLVNKQ